MLDDVLGGFLGAGLGAKMRASWVGRKEACAFEGSDVRLRARAHPSGAPDWRYWRGVLVRRGGTVRWRPWTRRWRSFDLSGEVLVGTRTQRSAAHGDRVILELRSVTRSDHLTVPVDCVQVALALLRPARGT